MTIAPAEHRAERWEPGLRLRGARVGRGISAEQLAAQLDVHPDSVRRLERRSRVQPARRSAYLGALAIVATTKGRKP